MIIFDCDGVLAETEYLFAQSDAQILQENGFSVTSDDLLCSYAGVAYEIMIADLEKQSGRFITPEIQRSMRNRAAQNIQESLQPVAGMPDVVRAIRGAKCVASNSHMDHLVSVLNLIGVYDTFQPHIFSRDQVARPKPWPDLHQYAAECLGVACETCVVIEDSVTGVQAAKAAGMTCIGFTGARHIQPGWAEKLRAAGADDIAFNAIGLLKQLQSFTLIAPELSEP